MVIKVKDLAKEVGVTEVEVLEELRKLYMEAEDGNSDVDDSIAGLIRHKFGGAAPAPKKKAPKKKAAPKKRPAKKKAAVEESAAGEKAGEATDRSKEVKARRPKKSEKVTGEKAEEPAAAEKQTEEAAGLEKPGKDTSSRKGPGRIRIIKKAEPQEKQKEEKVSSAWEEGSAEKDFKGGTKGASAEDEDVKLLKASKKSKKGKETKKEVWRAETTRVSFRKPSRKLKPGAAGSKSDFSANNAPSAAARKSPRKIQLELPVSVRDLAPMMNLKPSALIQYFMGKGLFVNMTQDLEEEQVREVTEHFGVELEMRQTVAELENELVAENKEDASGETETRAPIVTFMGHVDHGKTSLLDYIRETHVTKSEKGGITQHIGAYKVSTGKGAVTFLDTPGHEAFTAMRARGANATDVVVLVVAADDGVMPQTKEAIDHARAADVPIVVAINKCDLPGANPDKVKQELQNEGLSPEDWGGKTIMVEVSAKTGEGVEDLLELLMLESELLELKANPGLRARGIVVESKKSAGRGIVVTLLVQNGTLRPNDLILCGSFFGRIKAMMNDHGERVQEALPATPVEVLGLQGVPEAGEEFFEVKDEKKARILSELKQNQSRRKKMVGSQRVSLEDLYDRIKEGQVKELKMVLKADVQGSIEALKKSLEDLSTDEVKVKIIHDTVGNINESDVMLAVVSNAVIMGFHVKVDPGAEEIARKEDVDIHIYDVIYEAIAEVKAGMEGLLEPEEREVFQGRAQVLEVFSTSKSGNVAGCSVIKGTIHRKDNIRVKRGEEVVFEGSISALKRFKDDVRDVREGFECGISISGFNNIRKNDIIEAFVIEKVARRLDAKKK